MKILKLVIYIYLLSIVFINDLKAQNWTEVPYTTMTRPLMGRLTKMQIIQTNPVDPSTLTIYAAGDYSGLWKTSASGGGIGDSWTNLTPNVAPATILPNLGITAFVVDETNPQYMYIVTNWPSCKTQVFRSSSGGVTWTEITPAITLPSINSFLISFDDPTKIYAGTDDGIYTITNARTTSIWTKMAAPMDHGTFNNLIYKPNPIVGNNVILTSGSEIYQNVNGGGWTLMSGTGSGLSLTELNTLRGFTCTIRTFYVDASSTATYAWVIADWTQNATPKILFRYNGTSSWVSKGSPSAGFGFEDNGPGFFNIEIDPYDDQIVYAGGTQLHIFNDHLTTKWSNNGCYFSENTSCGPYKSHADMKSLKINPYDPTKLYVAHDGGLSWWNTGTSTWQMGTNNNLAIVMTNDFSCSPNGTDKILTGVWDDGTLFYDASASPTWTDIYRQGDGGPCYIYSDDIMFASYNSFSSSGYVLSKATKVSGVWGSFSYFISNANKINVDPVNNSVFYIGSKELIKVTNNASTKTTISNFASAFATTEDIKDFSAAASNTQCIYVIVNNRVFKTNTGGGTIAGSWTEISLLPFINPAYSFPSLTSVSVDPWNSNHIFIAYTDYGTAPFPVTSKVIESINGGSSWTDYSTGLPSAFPGEILSEKGSNCGLYLSTQLGIYYRNKTMSSWQSFSTGLPAGGTPLEINYKENKILTGSARGIWVSPLFCPSSTPLNLTGTAVNDFKETTTTIASTQTIPSGVVDKYRAGTVIALDPGFNAVAGSDFYAFIHNCNSSGNSFRLIEADAGINQSPALVKDDTRENEEIEVSVFPNPTAGDLTIKSSKEILEISVLDLSGKEISHIDNIHQFQYEMNLAKNEAVYIVNIRLDGKLVSKKVFLYPGYNGEDAKYKKRYPNALKK